MKKFKQDSTSSIVFGDIVLKSKNNQFGILDTMISKKQLQNSYNMVVKWI